MMPMMLLRPEKETKRHLGAEDWHEQQSFPQILLTGFTSVETADTDSLLSAGSRPTCSHEEDPSTQQDVVPLAVDASKANAEAAHHEQNGAEDGEQARRSN